jgi:hypothetical protein
MRDTSAWPADRNVDMFYEWFDVELVTEVVNSRGGVSNRAELLIRWWAFR